MLILYFLATEDGRYMVEDSNGNAYFIVDSLREAVAVGDEWVAAKEVGAYIID